MQKSVFGILAVLAIVLLAAGGVAAHGGDGNATHDDAPENGTAAEWGAWMEQHMTEQMGADAADRMQERMGMSYEEMGERMESSENSSMMGGMDGLGRMDGMGGMGCH